MFKCRTASWNGHIAIMKPITQHAPRNEIWKKFVINNSVLLILKRSNHKTLMLRFSYYSLETKTSCLLRFHWRVRYINKFIICYWILKPVNGIQSPWFESKILISKSLSHEFLRPGSLCPMKKVFFDSFLMKIFLVTKGIFSE